MADELTGKVDTAYRVLISTNPDFTGTLSIEDPHTVEIKNSAEGATVYATRIVPGQLVRAAPIDFPLGINGTYIDAGRGLRVCADQHSFNGVGTPYVEAGDATIDGRHLEGKVHLEPNVPYALQAGNVQLWVRYDRLNPNPTD